MGKSEPQDWFGAAWADREDRLYPTLFGQMPSSICPLSFDTFSGMSAPDKIDPRWLTHGVCEIAPNERRNSWLYASSGLSNAWEDDTPDPDSWSGLGCELVLQTREQSSWALTLLQRMVAFQICLAHDRFPGKPMLGMWNRIPLRAPIDGKSSALNFLLTTPAKGFQGTHQIPSGKFEFLGFVGITEDEAAFARERGGEKLYELLLENDAAVVTSPERVTVLK